MIKKMNQGVYLVDGKLIDKAQAAAYNFGEDALADAYKGTMAYSVLAAHNTTG